MQERRARERRMRKHVFMLILLRTLSGRSSPRNAPFGVGAVRTCQEDGQEDGQEEGAVSVRPPCHHFDS